MEKISNVDKVIANVGEEEILGGSDENIVKAYKIAMEQIKRGEGMELHEFFRKFRKEHRFKKI